MLSRLVQDGKFGIFIHWGLYSVPAFRNEWYARTMYTPGTAEFEHHVATYGPQTQFGYKDPIPLFRAEPLTQPTGPTCFVRMGQSSLLSLLLSIMTVSPCTTALSVVGLPPKWVPNAM